MGAQTFIDGEPSEEAKQAYRKRHENAARVYLGVEVDENIPAYTDEKRKEFRSSTYSVGMAPRN